MIALLLILSGPYTASGPLAIRAVNPDHEGFKQYEVTDYTVDLSATYDNPFDSSQVALDLEVTPASGTPYRIPGFFTRNFKRELKDGRELVSPDGTTSWHVRFSPPAAGAANLRFTAKDSTGSVATDPISITIEPATGHGPVRVSSTDSRYFAFADGTSFWPLGPNLGWGGDRGTFAYDDWLGKLGAQGANYGRLWLAPEFSTFAMETRGRANEGKGSGTIDLENAWKLDQVLDTASKNGIYLMLCIESFNILRSGNGNPFWNEATENVANGGPLRSPSDFWTSDKMAKQFKDKLRYLVARYGAFDHTLSWELWNEVDLVDDFNVDQVREWHAKMATYLRSIDANHHLITTSFGQSTGYKPIDLMPQLDYFQTHHYGPDPASEVVNQQSRKGGQGRPHYVGEIGADVDGPRAESDPTGIQVHDPLWASIATGSSGSAAAWYWDSLIAAKDLWPIYGAAARFIQGVDWQTEGFRQTPPTFAYVTKPTVPPMRDVEFLNGPVSWDRSPANAPRDVRIDGKGRATGDLPLPGILHGRTNHPELMNPVTFHTGFANPCTFELLVGGVSGYGGAGFQIELDGTRVLSRTFDDADPKTETMHQFGGTFPVPIPAGDHTIVVRNTGADWFMSGFRFVNAIPRTVPEVQGWSVVGDTTALAWLRREGRSWQRAIAGPMPPSAPSVMGLTGLAAGRWKVELWDTWKGAAITTSFATVGLDGRIRVNLPAIATDLAVKLTKQ